MSVWTYGYLFYTLTYKSKTFVVQLVQTQLLGVLLCPFDTLSSFYSFFEHFLTFFCYSNMLQAHLEYFLPQPQNESFIQGALVPFIGEWYQKPRSGWQVCLLLLRYYFSLALSADSKEIHVCILALYVCTLINILCKYMKFEFSLMSLTLIP